MLPRLAAHLVKATKIAPPTGSGRRDFSFAPMMMTLLDMVLLHKGSALKSGTGKVTGFADAG